MWALAIFMFCTIILPILLAGYGEHLDNKRKHQHTQDVIDLVEYYDPPSMPGQYYKRANITKADYQATLHTRAHKH